MRQRLRTTRQDMLADLLAGATNALSYVPQGMAYAVVAGGRTPSKNRTNKNCDCDY